MIFRLEMHLTAASGRRIIHRGYFVAQNQGAAEAKCAEMMVAYQPATALQVTKVFVQGQEIAYEILRPEASGVLQRRLIISAASAHIEPHCRRGRIQIAVSDPVDGILEYVEHEEEPPPQVWANFHDGFLSNLCDAGGNGWYKLVCFSFAERPRQADMGPPTDDRASNVWRDYMIYHGGLHLSDGADPIVYVRTRYIPVALMAYDGYYVDYYDSAYAARMESNMARNCYLTVDLKDYVSGDIVLSIMHRASVAGAGNVRHRVRGACIADGVLTTDQFDESITLPMRADLKVEVVELGVISAQYLSRGKVLVVRVGRDGLHEEDTFTKNTGLIAVALRYLSDFVSPS